MIRMSRVFKGSIVLLLVVLLAACGASNNGGDDLESKKKELEESRKELADLKQKISKLEGEIEQLNGGESEEVLKPVRIETAQKSTYRHPVVIQGVVKSEGNIVVSAEASGTVLSVSVDEGQAVTKGQLIAKLDDEVLQNTLSELRKSYELAEVTFEKQENLWNKNIGSEIEYLQAKNRKESLEQQIETIKSRIGQTELRAPISGTVDELFVNEGELVSPGAPVVRLVDMRNVEITADVSERYLGVFSRGDSVEVYFPAVKDTLKGTIKAVGNVINSSNRTFKMLVRIPSGINWLKPNLLSKITAYDRVFRNSIVIPTRLLHYQEGNEYLYIAMQEGEAWMAQKQPVELIESYPDFSIVKKGLEPGQQIITQGYSNISEGEKLEIVQ